MVAKRRRCVGKQHAPQFQQSDVEPSDAVQPDSQQCAAHVEQPSAPDGGRQSQKAARGTGRRKALKKPAAARGGKAGLRHLARSGAPKSRSAYAIYMSKVYAQLGGRRGLSKKEHESIIAKVGQQWRELSDEERLTYKDLAKAEFEKKQAYVQSVLRAQDEPDAASNIDEPDETVFGAFTLVSGQNVEMGVLDLGSGKYGRVLLSRHRERGVLACVKIFHEQAAFELEMKVYKKVEKLRTTDSPVVPFCKVWASSDASLAMPWICLEYMPETLRGYLAGHPAGLKDDALNCLLQVADGLTFLHRNGLAHADVKLGNIMYDARTSVAKLVNFVFADKLDERMENFMPYTGVYRAPEVWNGGDERGGRLTLQSEAWAVGCVLVEAAVGEPLFADTHDIFLFEKLRKNSVKFRQALPMVHRVIHAAPTRIAEIAWRLLDNWRHRMKLDEFCAVGARA